MAHGDKTQDLDNFDFGIIKKKARQIIGLAGFSRQDREDVEQELYLRLLKAQKKFDSRRGHRKAFTTAVVERSYCNIKRDARAQKRDYRRISSLNVTIEVNEDGAVELADTISDREYHARRSREPRSPEELAQLVFDLADVLELLPDDLAELAERLKTQSIAAAARDIEKPRTTVNDAVRRLRHQTEDTGLREYL